MKPQGQRDKDTSPPQPAPFNPLPDDNMSDPVIAAYIIRMRKEFGKYVKSPEETRRIVDEAMGKHTLTEELYRMRREEELL